MDTTYLLPGEERCVDFRDANGVPKGTLHLLFYPWQTFQLHLLHKKTKLSGCVKIGS